MARAPPLALAGEGDRVARAAQRVLVQPRSRCAGGGTHMGRTARPPPAPALGGGGGDGWSRRAGGTACLSRCDRDAHPAAHTWAARRALHQRRLAGGGHVARTAQHVLGPQRSRCAGGDTRLGRTARALRQPAGEGCSSCSSIDNILQQNTASVISIHCSGSVVQAAAHYPQGTGFNTCQVHF